MKRKPDIHLVQARNYIRKNHNPYAGYLDAEVKKLAALLRKSFNKGLVGLKLR
jgi:hypothetical protein